MISPIWLLFLLSTVCAQEPKKVHLIIDHGTSYQRPKDLDASDLTDDRFIIKTAEDKKGLETGLDEISKLDLKEGDQVLITINTHGDKAMPSQRLHSVILEDGYYDLKGLEETLRTLAKKKVLIGVLDLSCFSSPSLDLARIAPEQICVVTGNSVNAPAMATFSNHLFEGSSAGDSLESAFLKARQTIQTTTPGISTVRGVETDQILDHLRQLISLGGWYNFTDLTRTKVRSGPILSCQDTVPPTEPVLNLLVAQLSQILPRGATPEGELLELFQTLQTMRGQYERNLAEYPGLRESLARVEIIDGEKFTWLELMDCEISGTRCTNFMNRVATDYSDRVVHEPALTMGQKANLLNMHHRQTPEEIVTAIESIPWSPRIKSHFIGLFQHFLKIRQTHEMLLLSDKNYKLIANRDSNSDPLRSIFLFSQFELANIEQRLYDKIYNSLPNLSSSPCARFKL